MRIWTFDIELLDQQRLFAQHHEIHYLAQARKGMAAGYLRRKGTLEGAPHIKWMWFQGVQGANLFQHLHDHILIPALAAGNNPSGKDHQTPFNWIYMPYRTEEGSTVKIRTGPDIDLTDHFVPQVIEYDKTLKWDELLLSLGLPKLYLEQDVWDHQWRLTNEVQEKKPQHLKKQAALERSMERYGDLRVLPRPE